MQPGRCGDDDRIQRFVFQQAVEIPVDRGGKVLAQHIKHEAGLIADHRVDIGMCIEYREMGQAHLSQTNNRGSDAFYHPRILLRKYPKR